MKLRLLTLGIAFGAIAVAGTAAATPEPSAETLTIGHSWRIEHDNLQRQFSQGLGVDLSDRSTLVASADRHRNERAREHGVKRANTKLSER